MKNLKFCDGSEVNIGDEGLALNTVNNLMFPYTVTKETIPVLIKLGIIVEIQKQDFVELTESARLAKQIQVRSENIPMSISHYHNVLAEKLAKVDKVGVVVTSSVLFNIKKVNKYAYFSMILKEIALTMDQSYSNHISEHPVLFAISQKDGRPVQIVKESWTTLIVGALFRTKADAIVALKILAPLRKEIFNNGRNKK